MGSQRVGHDWAIELKKVEKSDWTVARAGVAVVILMSVFSVFSHPLAKHVIYFKNDKVRIKGLTPPLE